MAKEADVKKEGTTVAVVSAADVTGLNEAIAAGLIVAMQDAGFKAVLEDAAKGAVEALDVSALVNEAVADVAIVPQAPQAYSALGGGGAQLTPVPADKEDVLNVRGIAGAYELGTGEWRGQPSMTGRDFRNPNGYFPKKIDERYFHTHAVLSRVMCFGADPSIAKDVEASLRIDEGAELAVGSRITALQVPELHTIHGGQILVDRITTAFDGLGFKVFAWLVDAKTGKREDITSLVIDTKYGTDGYKTADGLVYDAWNATGAWAVPFGKAVQVGIEITAVPADIKAVMSAMASGTSEEQFRTMVALNVTQGIPQVDEGMGDQYIPGQYKPAN